MDLKERVLKFFNRDVVENMAKIGMAAGATFYLIYAVNRDVKDQNDLYLMLAGLGTLLGSAAIAGASRYSGMRLCEIDRERGNEAYDAALRDYRPPSRREQMRKHRAILREGWELDTFYGAYTRPVPKSFQRRLTDS